MPTKDIIFKVRVDDQASLQKIQALEKELSNVVVTTQGKLSPALNVSRRDLGILATQMITTTGVAGKMTGQLSNLATGLLTGGVIGGAFAGFAAIINGITDRITEHNKAMDAFGNSTLNVATKLSLINNELQSLAEPGFWERITRGLLVIAGQWRQTAQDIIIDMAQLESQRRSLLGGMLMSPHKYPSKDKGSKNTRDIISEYMRQFSYWQGRGGDAGAQRGPYDFTGTPFGVGGVGTPQNPISQTIQDALMDDKNIQAFESIAEGWRGVLNSQFSMFWDETFGYANSLLEMLLKSTFEGIFAQLSTSLLSFLPGGGLFGFLGGLFGSPSQLGAGTSNQPVILKIGDEDVGTFVRKGNEYNRMRRMN